MPLRGNDGQNGSGLEAQIAAFLEEMGAEGIERMLRNPPGGKDRELARWPIVEHRLLDHQPDEAERSSLESEKMAAGMAVKVAMGRLGDSTEKPTDSDIHHKALIEILLRNAETPDQIRKLVSAYVVTQMQLQVREQFRVVIQGPDGQPSDPIEIEHRIVEGTPARWKTLTECSRIPEWIVFRHALDTRQFETYALEPGHDGVFTLLADPREIYMLDFNPEAEGVPIPKVTRNRPENKRMTPEKLARFFQMHGLYKMIEDDAYERHPAQMGNSVSILAEYFCENDDVVRKNHINTEDVQKWLEAKFLEFRPPLEVAWYVFGRLQGTAFDRVGRFIEQYILDIHEQQHPWLFDLGMLKRSQCKGEGKLFEIYANALKTCQYSFKPEDKAKYLELMQVLPSIPILQTTLASKIYGHDENAMYVLRYSNENSSDFCPQYKQVANINLATDPLDQVREVFDYDSDVPYEWKAYPGFELLDPMEMVKTCTGFNRFIGMAKLMESVVEKLRQCNDGKILKRFKKEVLDKIDPVRQKVLQQMLEEILTPMAAEALFKTLDSDEVVSVARGTSTPDIPRRIVLPGDVEWGEIMGRPFDPRRVSTAAEQEMLRRHLKGARGADEIGTYLMSHVSTMRPSEVVRPNPDSPHDDIVRDFGESPDLLSLLDMATILTYLGYDPDQVKAEIAMQAQLSAEAARPELAMVGVESELVTATPDGLIVNPDTYKWLFNILPRDEKDRTVNEIMTAPTSSAVMQAMLFSTIVDPRFGFVHADRLWEQNTRPDRQPSSLHLNISIPEGLPFTPDLIQRYMQDLQRMQWIAYGGDNAQHRIAKGRISGWRDRSLLDVMGNVNHNLKAEIRNLRLEQDGSHITRMRELQLLASACIQFMREQGGLKLSTNGKAMAEIYKRFQMESQGIRGNEENASGSAKHLIERYSGEIAKELGLKEMAKNEGIVIVPSL